ncbi:MAG: hypothetical protein V1779_17775 [bacterium]
MDFNNNICIANQNTYDILKIKKIKKDFIDISLLPEIPKGKGDINELNNTDVFIQALKLPDFYFLLYPNFEYLIPDALMVLKQNYQYKLVFIEVEAQKPNWDSYLENKLQNYIKLSQNIDVYNYWISVAPKLKLRIPTIDEFKFTVAIIGNITKDWGDCFIFRKSLNE